MNALETVSRIISFFPAPAPTDQAGIVKRFGRSHFAAASS